MKSKIKKSIWYFIRLFPLGNKIYETLLSQTPITFKYWFFQKILGFNRKAYWPVHFTSRVNNITKIKVGVDTCPGYMNNCYIQGSGGIDIGDYTQIAPNVGIISSNHDLYDSRKSIKKNVEIGRYCWLGMGSIILPGVKLGDFTIVAAGSVVTKSFEDGYSVIGGTPAKIIRKLEKDKCKPFKNDIEYNGYIHSSKFKLFSEKHLNL
tara:strand:- start:205 stop:825 length:621 start_codon:yes stop_codon:yes gene_type:complete